MTPETFDAMLARLHAAGLAEQDIDWSEGATPPADAEEFALEAIFVICNGGMKNTVARRIYDRIVPVLTDDRGPVSSVFGHKLKCRAIERIWRERQAMFAAYLAADDKVEFCASLPHIGQITKFHLAKNFGVDVAKPDVHLQRLADLDGTTAQAMCERLAARCGLKARTVDVLIWRACATGIMDSRTGRLS